MDNCEFKYEVELLFGTISTKFSELLREFYDPYGITAPQAMILIALHKRGPGKIGDMAKTLNMTNSNLSVICRRLERSGFLLRKRNEIDQRVVHLYLTEKSQAFLEELEKKITTDYLCSLEQASDEDKEVILKGLRKLSELLTCTEQ